MCPDQVLNPRRLALESDMLPTGLHGRLMQNGLVVCCLLLLLQLYAAVSFSRFIALCLTLCEISNYSGAYI